MDYLSFLGYSFVIFFFIILAIFNFKHKNKIIFYPIRIDATIPTREISLADALNSPIERHLAFNYFRLLVINKDKRISDLLLLSHPGNQPYAWNSVLIPTLKVIEEMKIRFRAYISTINKIDQEHIVGKKQENGVVQTEKPVPRIIYSTMTSLEGLHENTCDGAINLRLRDMVSPVEAKVIFKKDCPVQNPKRNSLFLDSQKSPARYLAEAPSKMLRTATLRTKKYIADNFSKIKKIIHRPNLMKDFKELLEDQELVFSATEILTGVCQYSTKNDPNGVIATTVGRIVQSHIEFYEAVEDLVIALQPIKPYSEVINSRHILLQILEEYRKALVFFYNYYRTSIQLFEIPNLKFKEWDRICSSERTIISSITSGMDVDKNQTLWIAN